MPFIERFPEGTLGRAIGAGGKVWDAQGCLLAGEIVMCAGFLRCGRPLPSQPARPKTFGRKAHESNEFVRNSKFFGRRNRPTMRRALLASASSSRSSIFVGNIISNVLPGLRHDKRGAPERRRSAQLQRQNGDEDRGGLGADRA